MVTALLYTAFYFDAFAQLSTFLAWFVRLFPAKFISATLLESCFDKNLLSSNY